MSNRIYIWSFTLSLLALAACSPDRDAARLTDNEIAKMERYHRDTVAPSDISFGKDLLYKQYTLKDSYPYKSGKDTITRTFQWEKIKLLIAEFDNFGIRTNGAWAVLQNYRNANRVPPLARNAKENEYRNMADINGVERPQAIPLYLPDSLDIPEIYGRDGWLAKIQQDSADFFRVTIFHDKREWLVPKQYVKILDDSTRFDKRVFVDVTNQNMTAIERDSAQWTVRSMNAATTGRYKPPYARRTPLGAYAIQMKRKKMLYLKDGTNELAGYAPNASRFSNGAYIHGVPLNSVNAKPVEISYTLGTVPLSHECVRTVTSHAQFIYDWGPVFNTIVFIID